MRKQLLALTAFMAVILISCGSVDQRGDSGKYREMVEKVQDLEFEIENQWANPVKYGRVNLLGNPNYIKFEGDSVDLFLPFFGERHSGGGYGSQGAIEYEGPLQDLQIEEREDKKRIHIYFQGRQDSEILNFRITIFPNGNTNTSVTSSQRDQIDYDGKIQRIKS